MKSVKTYSAAVVLAALASTASAQVSKTVPGTMETLTVTVDSIERASRVVTIKKPDGTYGVFSVPADVKRFDTLKVGDKITATYYENIIAPPQGAWREAGRFGDRRGHPVRQQERRDGRRAADDHRDDHQ